jgi:hypothetical protein
MTNPEALAIELRRHSRQALAQVGLRLARSLHQQLPAEVLGPHLAFAEGFAQDAGLTLSPLPARHALARLEALAPSPVAAALLRDLLLLACLPQAHEGFGALCRLMHPEGLNRPTPTLALHWLESERVAGGLPFELRDRVEALLCHSPTARLGLMHLHGDGLWAQRSLLPGPGIWEALMAYPPQLPQASLTSGYAQVPGLEPWLATAVAAQAVQALRQQLPCQILLVGGDAAMRATRVRALLGAAQASALRVDLDAIPPAAIPQAQGAALLLDAVLWLDSQRDEGPNETAPAPVLEAPAAVITSGRHDRGVPRLGLPLLRLDVAPLAATARRSLWQALLPQLGDQAGLLAARYPIEPDDAREVVRDLGLQQALSGGPLAIDAINDCIRARTVWSERPGVQRVVARAGWDALLLPSAQRRQLQSAVRRVLQQITVLDDWGFAQGRSERRGVRLLLAGPPGTGKSLAAEVMARELGVDLLVVDLASLVSKWLGETEKNLAAVFEVAERSRALLLFDEADALFAKRTESKDAHDRYANLETAYLLQRLERYESIAVLTTNLRANLDVAFSRRFEFIVEFPEPDAAAREALWRLHLPRTAPLAADVDLPELAAWYAISGAQIKNAALSAAFLAASANSEIHQRHFLLAIEREFDKAGRAHPGFPAHCHWPTETDTST